MEKIHESDKMNFDNIDAIRDHAIEILTAQEFDKTEFIDTLSEIDKSASRFHKNMTLAIANAAEGLNQDVRRQLATKLSQMRPAPPRY